jgi:hypothetical protein
VVDGLITPLITRLRVGGLYPSLLILGGFASTSSLAPNVLRATLYPVIRKMKFDLIATYFPYTVAGVKCRVGVYECDENLYPSTLVLDAGELDVTSGSRSIAIDLTLDRGNYFVAFNLSNNAYFRVETSYIPPMWSATDFTRFIGWYKTVTYAPLPSTFPSEASQDGYAYAVGLRLAEIV